MIVAKDLWNELWNDRVIKVMDDLLSASVLASLVILEFDGRCQPSWFVWEVTVDLFVPGRL